MIDLIKIRNFCIIAHIDHGKSTLADRFLELTGTVNKREMKEQILDSMDIERERGITIKLTPVRMDYTAKDGQKYVLNLIDTPGHVDFTYEVSRSLAAVEGAILLVDATQGIQAQTLANLYLALDQNLEIIPVANKIDLPSADKERITQELAALLGCPKEEIIGASGKTGLNVPQILERVIEKVPAPRVSAEKKLRALIFDSLYDEYKGVIAYVRIIDGSVKAGDKIQFMFSAAESEVLEVGVFKPNKLLKTDALSSGEIGYIVSGVKELGMCRVGDTIADLSVTESLPGYKEVTPFVFAGIFCKNGDDFPRLREAIEKLKLNDAALSFEPENNSALGFGFRCGFLGLLHLDIVQERLEREYDLELIVTVPSVGYKVYKRDRPDEAILIKSAQELPDPSATDKILEPVMAVDIVCPKEHVGAVMQLAVEKRGHYLNTEYLDADRAVLHYKISLASLIIDFYDRLKSVSAGYASMNYQFSEYEKADVVRLDIFVAEKRMDSLSILVYQDDAYHIGKRMVEKLKEILPRQMFEVKIQAALGGKVIASERIPAMRKDVTKRLSGGDSTRRMKLLEKQKKGKKKMKEMGTGRVDIPPEAFIAVFKR
ncbi:MAG: elongation factor 4 [Parcubacteria group bacterium]|nr:elongation factor 4 [Parcubacteria group bacterium]